ncbi:MAG: hypothetical protein EOP10_19465, partial [Proteobacteria bacterium]
NVIDLSFEKFGSKLCLGIHLFDEQLRFSYQNAELISTPAIEIRAHVDFPKRSGITDTIRLYQIRKSMILVASSMDDFDGLKKSILRKAKAGLMTATSAQTLQLELERFKRDLIILKGEESELQDHLLLVLGLSPDQLITLDKMLTVDSVMTQATSEATVGNLPEIKRYDLLSESRRLESSSRKEWWLPEVSAYAAYTGFRVEEASQIRSLPEDELVFGLRFTLDLESKRTLKTESAGLSADITSYQAQKEYLRREVAHKIHEYNREIKVQAELMKASDETIDKTHKVLGRLRSEFEKGLGSNVDVAEMIRSIYQSKKLRLQSETEFLLASAGLETLTSL